MKCPYRHRYLLVPILTISSILSFAKDRRTEGSLTIDLPGSFEVISEVVSEIASDGTIRGTGQYATEQQITGAVPAQSSNLLQPSEIAPGAAVFYKVREGTLAPRHFNGSNDQGTLVLAYIVSRLSPEKSRLTIESVFVPDTRHGRSASDGSVETCEFTAIEARMKALAEAKALEKERKDKEEQEVRLRTLRRQLAEEQSRYDALHAQAQQLEKRSSELRQLTVVRSKSSTARLKDLPYTHADNLRSLVEGEELVVLYRTANWYRVRTHEGQIGWVFHSSLEAAQ
jgi:hypothetical protein